MQYGVVQHNDARSRQRPGVNIPVQPVVAKMIEMNVGS